MPSETPKTKDTGLFPSHRISELKGALDIIQLLFLKREGNMEVLRGDSGAELPKVMQNWKTLVSTVLFPKWTFIMYCLIS